MKTALSRCCLLSFSNFSFGFHGFRVEKLKIIQYDFQTGTQENLVVNHKDDRVFKCLGTIGQIVAPWKFDVLKTNLFALRYLHLYTYQPVHVVP